MQTPSKFSPETVPVMVELVLQVRCRQWNCRARLHGWLVVPIKHDVLKPSPAEWRRRSTGDPDRTLQTLRACQSGLDVCI